MSGPADIVGDLLGFLDDEPWSWAAAAQEAGEASEALKVFHNLFPLVDGYGLAEYLRRLGAEVATVVRDYDALRATLSAVRLALAAPPVSASSGVGVAAEEPKP